MIKGAEELKKCLNGLPDQFKHPTLQKAIVKAAEPLVSRMHRLAPVGLKGNLADSIGIVKLKKGRELGGIEVGPRRGGGFLGYAGQLVEFGTKRRTTKRTGANRGIMPKKRFVLPAWEQTNSQVLGTVEKELSVQVTKYLKRTAPK